MYTRTEGERSCVYMYIHVDRDLHVHVHMNMYLCSLSFPLPLPLPPFFSLPFPLPLSPFLFLPPSLPPSLLLPLPPSPSSSLLLPFPLSLSQFSDLFLSNRALTIEIGASFTEDIVDQNVPGGKHEPAVVDGVHKHQRNLQRPLLAREKCERKNTSLQREKYVNFLCHCRGFFQLFYLTFTFKICFMNAVS